MLSVLLAEYLRDRFRSRAPESLITWLLNREELRGAFPFPWDHPLLPEAPAGLQDAIDHGRNFSELMHGAALLYNLMLADRLNHAEWIEKYREALSEWAETSRSEEHVAWDRGAFWRLVYGVNSRIAPAARSFCEDWFAQVFSTPNLAEIADSGRAQELVRTREKQLKGPRSRLDNREYLEVASNDKPLPCRIILNKKPATGAIVAAYLLQKSGRDFLKKF